MSQKCTCGEKFLDAEDWRDHLPCPGSPEEQAYARGFANATKRIVSRLRRRSNQLKSYATSQEHSCAGSAGQELELQANSIERMKKE